MKSEPDEYSLEDLAAQPNQTGCWEGEQSQHLHCICTCTALLRHVFRAPSTAVAQVPR